MDNMTKHYVWLGGKPLSHSAKYCINSWRKFCPSCEIKEWNEANFPIDKYTWVREAIRTKKYAFASDYIRIKVLKEYGGIYMDTDVELTKDITPLLEDSFVTGFLNHHFGTDYMKNVSDDGMLIDSGEKATGFGINTGFIYSKPYHPVIDLLDSKIYNGGDKHFVNLDGTINQMIIDGVVMNVLHDYFNAKFKDLTQELSDGIKIYNSQVIATQKTASKSSYLIHWFDGSWKESPKTKKDKFKMWIRTNYPQIYRLITSFK